MFVGLFPDGQTLASVESLGTVRLWNAAAGRQLEHRPRGKDDYQIHAAAFSPDRKAVASVSQGEKILRLWR